jgi:hypothetical protein
MHMRDFNVDEARAAITKAHDHVGAIALGETRWTMHIPAQPERDSDLILTAGLDAGEKAVAAVEKLLAEIHCLSASESLESALLRRRIADLETRLAQLESVPELRRKASA